MSQRKVVYEAGTRTIRIQPEDYVLATLGEGNWDLGRADPALPLTPNQVSSIRDILAADSLPLRTRLTALEAVLPRAPSVLEALLVRVDLIVARHSTFRCDSMVLAGGRGLDIRFTGGGEREECKGEKFVWMAVIVESLRRDGIAATLWNDHIEVTC